MPSKDGFQQIVNNELPPAVPGDFAGANIRASLLAGFEKFVTPPGGTNTGFMGWGSSVTGFGSNYYQPNAFVGFVHRDEQALITAYLANASVNIPGGDPVTLLSQGDFWGNFALGGTAGQKVYADPLTGALTAAATGASVNGTLTGSITAGVLTVSAITGTPLAVGQVIWGAGVVPGTYIVSDGSGTGGTGTYNLANADGTAIANVGSETLNYAGAQETQFFLMQTIDTGASVTASIAAPANNAPGGIMTVTAVGSGVVEVGQYIAGTGVPTSPAPQVLYQISGTTGGVGTYMTSYTSSGTAIGSETLTTTAGQYAKISSWA